MPQYVKTTWVNGSSPAINATNLNKIENGIFATITQDGSTSMSGQFVTISGSAATPSIAPTGDANTGIFFSGADVINMTSGGTPIFTASTSSVALTNSQIFVNAGTAGTPSISPTGDGNTGIFFPAAEEISISTNGLSRIRQNTTSMIVGTDIEPNNSFTLLARETNSTTRYPFGAYPALANTTATPAMRLLKYDNTNSTAQIYIQFLNNLGGTGGGQINGNGASQAAFGSFSDARLKENIENLPNQLENINDLRPVEFDYKDGSGHQIGFIAQEIQMIYPDAVNVGADEYLTVTGWGKTEAILVKAIQELTEKVENLESRITALGG
jgi:hypothetical protein